MYENYKILLRSNISNRSFYLKKETKGETFLIIFYSPFTTFYSFFLNPVVKKLLWKKLLIIGKRNLILRKFSMMFFIPVCVRYSKNRDICTKAQLFGLLKKIITENT